MLDWKYRLHSIYSYFACSYMVTTRSSINMRYSSVVLHSIVDQLGLTESTVQHVVGK